MIAAATLSTIALPAADPFIGQPTPCVKVTDLVGPDFSVKQCGISDVDQHRAGPGEQRWRVLRPNAPVGWLTTKVKELDPEDQTD